MKEALAVMAGGALGSLARWGVAIWFASQPWSEKFPWATLAVNVTGSFAIGFLAELMIEDGPFFLGSGFRAFLLVGILGGFTTFSAFSLQTLALVRDGQPALAVWNIFLSVAVCFFAVWLGILLAQKIHSLAA
ncbi:MAG: fluoride efflux transporter CrcB [Verrucomicrobiota bacterium]